MTGDAAKDEQLAKLHQAMVDVLECDDARRVNLTLYVLIRKMTAILNA